MEKLVDRDVVGGPTTAKKGSGSGSGPIKRKSQKKLMELEKSVKEYEQVKETYTKLFGADDEKTIAISDIIAGQLFQLHRYDDALAMYISLLENYQHQYGPWDEKSLKVNEKIIMTYLMMGQSEAFLEALESLCKLYSEELSYEASDIGEIKLMYVNYLEREGNYTTAEIVLGELLSTYTATYGDNSIKSIKIEVRIAEILMKKGSYDKALTSLTSIVEELEETHGPITVETLDSRRLIANIYIKIGELDTALDMFIDLFTKYMQCYGGECYETLTIRTSIAATLLKQTDYEQALNIYTAVYESYLNLPETSPEVTTHIKHIIGHIHLKENRLYEAENLFREALHEYEEIYDGDETHINVVETKASLGALLLKEKKFNESRDCYVDILKQYKNIYGESHEKTIQVEDILIDLNELDSMLTNDDREIIHENVRMNEANNFGSQDFDKYILPSRSDVVPVETKMRSVSMLTTKSMASTNAGNGTDSETTSYPGSSIATEILHRASLPVTPMIHKKYSKGSATSKTQDSDEIKKITGQENPNNIVDADYLVHRNHLEDSTVQERGIDIGDEIDSIPWDDVSLDETQESQREDIMEDIRRQQLAKRDKKSVKNCAKCSCCTIS